MSIHCNIHRSTFHSHCAATMAIRLRRMHWINNIYDSKYFVRLIRFHVECVCVCVLVWSNANDRVSPLCYFPRLTKRRIRWHAISARIVIFLWILWMVFMHNVNKNGAMLSRLVARYFTDGTLSVERRVKPKLVINYTNALWMREPFAMPICQSTVNVYTLMAAHVFVWSEICFMTLFFV